MSILEANPIVDVQENAAPVQLSPEKPGVVERLDVRALEQINVAMQTALDLQKRLNGLKYPTAAKCRTMVDDYFVGLADLRHIVTQMGQGKPEEAAKIPGLLRAFQDSLDFEALLKGNRGYKKDGEQVMAGYIHDTIKGLSDSFTAVTEAVRPLSEAMEVEGVRMNVRHQVSKLAGIKFNTSKGIQQLAEVQKPVTVELAETPAAPLSLNWDVNSHQAPVLEAAPFSALEESWFKNEVAVAPEAPTAKLRKGIFDRVSSVLGSLFGSARRSAPRVGAAAVLALAACGGSEPSVPEAPAIPMAHYEEVPLAPATEATPAEDWSITDTRDVTHAIRSALINKCGMTRAEAVKVEGEFVHTALVNKTEALTIATTEKQGSDTDGKWLSRVTTDEARYGNTVPNDYTQVLGNVGHTRLVGAHNLDSLEVSTIAYSGLPAFATYTCPAN